MTYTVSGRVRGVGRQTVTFVIIIVSSSGLRTKNRNVIIFRNKNRIMGFLSTLGGGCHVDELDDKYL